MEDFRVCPACQYQKGFHIALKKVKGRVRLMLICPECGQSFDIGWSTSAVKSFKHETGPVY